MSDVHGGGSVTADKCVCDAATPDASQLNLNLLLGCRGNSRVGAVGSTRRDDQKKKEEKKGRKKAKLQRVKQATASRQWVC